MWKEQDIAYLLQNSLHLYADDLGARNLQGKITSIYNTEKLLNLSFFSRGKIFSF